MNFNLIRCSPSAATPVPPSGLLTLFDRLPPMLAADIRRHMREDAPREIRLRVGPHSCLCYDDVTLPLTCALTRRELSEILVRLCGGSMYAHKETLRLGYLTLRGGIRVGVCGRVRVSGTGLGIPEVSSLILRIPRPLSLPTETVCRLLCDTHPGRGVLIYSPPGVGKTSLLRSLIVALAGPPYERQLAVIDTREELSACGTRECCGAEWLVGYPRAVGIEIATRTLAPHLIVCDEIGEAGEAEAICAACNAGVPLLATAHGADLPGLLRRRGLCLLHEQGVFGSYVALSRRADGSLCQQVTAMERICGTV